MGLAVVTRIPSLVEAHIAAGALRSAGIDAQVFDGAFGQVESPVIEALGGFRIMAPEADVVAAREILKALQAGPGLGEPEDNAPWTASLARRQAARTRPLRTVFLIASAIGAVIWLARVLAG